MNAEDYLASLTALFEQAPDVTVETLYTIAVDRHGVLMLARNFGTLRGDRIVGVEMFEPEDLDVARARFAELRG